MKSDYSIQKFDLKKIVEKITEPWSPVEVARVNDFALRAAKFEGAYHWHAHGNSDELFVVFRGRIKIQVGSGEIILGEGEGAVIPRGVAHCPVALEPSVVLMFEPKEMDSSKVEF